MQFLLAGLVLYVGLSWFYPQDSPSSKVIVSQETMQEFLQYRHKSSDQQSAVEYWESLDDLEKEALIVEYLHDELLFREALNLGLDADDQVIRQRLIRKVEFAVQDLPVDQLVPSDDQMRAYFASSRSDYRMPAAATFTHVFLSKQRATPDELRLEASDMLLKLTQGEVPFENASQHGDAFHFHRNYVGRDPLFISSHFGEDFSKQIFALSETEHWLGPFESRHGLHLVMLRKMEDSWIPEYEDVAGAVMADMRKVAWRKARSEALKSVADKYEIEYLDVAEPDNGL